MTNSKEIRVAIIGVGNCANSLIQGVTYYKDAAADVEIPGLMHAVLGGYHVRDVNFVAAFDVDAKKVGLDLADAIWASENNTIKFCRCCSNWTHRAAWSHPRWSRSLLPRDHR